MGNASLSKFAIGRIAQADKDTVDESSMLFHPHMYNSGFDVSSEVDNFGDIVEPNFEASKTQILSAITGGRVVVPATADMLALCLSSMLGSVVTTQVAKTFVDGDVDTGTDIITIATHGFSTGDPVRLSNSGGALPTGTDNVTTYYVRAVTAGTLTLHTSSAGASANTGKVDITTAAGGGNHTIAVYPAVYKHVITSTASADPNFHTVWYHDGTNDCRVKGTVMTALSFGCGFQNKRMNMDLAMTAISRETNSNSYGTVAPLNPFHFTNTGADLSLTQDGSLIATYDEVQWAGFSYGLQNSIDAEMRSGSNALKIIEIVDRLQTLSLLLDYDDATFKEIINDYQTSTYPPQFEISMTLQGKQLAGAWYNKISATFYNCILGNHSYTPTPEIGKQSLDFTVNYDATALKSSQFTIYNDQPQYIS